MINHSASGMFAIRMDEWKLVLGNGSGAENSRGGRRFTPPWQLFHLEDDPAETTDDFPGNSISSNGWKLPFFKYSPTTKAENKNHEQT